MKVFIAADMEGITGVVHRDQLMPGGADYQTARSLMTADINAAIDGVLSVYPEAEIVVGDGHGTMRNVLIHELRYPAQLVAGPAQPRNKPLLQLQGFDASFNAAIMIGYHSMAGVEQGLLAHTFVGSTIKRLLVAGAEVGEVTANAMFFGEHDVPVWAVSGNSCLEPEVRANLSKHTQFFATKITQGPTCGVCKHPQDSTEGIQQAVVQGAQSHRTIAPCQPTSNTIVVEFYRREMAFVCEQLPLASRIDPLTVQFTGSTYAEAFQAMWFGVSSANKQYPEWMS